MAKCYELDAKRIFVQMMYDPAMLTEPTGVIATSG